MHRECGWLQRAGWETFKTKVLWFGLLPHTTLYTTKYFRNSKGIFYFQSALIQYSKFPSLENICKRNLFEIKRKSNLMILFRVNITYSVAYLAHSNYSLLHLIILLTPRKYPEMNFSNKSLYLTVRNKESQDFYFLPQDSLSRKSHSCFQNWSQSRTPPICHQVASLTLADKRIIINIFIYFQKQHADLKAFQLTRTWRENYRWNPRPMLIRTWTNLNPLKATEAVL